MLVQAIAVVVLVGIASTITYLTLSTISARTDSGGPRGSSDLKPRKLEPFDLTDLRAATSRN